MEEGAVVVTLATPASPRCHLNWKGRGGFVGSDWIFPNFLVLAEEVGVAGGLGGGGGLRGWATAMLPI